MQDECEVDRERELRRIEKKERVSIEEAVFHVKPSSVLSLEALLTRLCFLGPLYFGSSLQGV
jgi:hypothetical protein